MGTRVRLRAIRRALSCLAVIGVFCGQIMHAPHRAQTLRQARRDLPEDHIVATASAGAAPRIAFRLHAPDVVPRPDRFLSVPRYVCGDGRGGDDGARGALPPALARASVLNFTATVSTDLRVLFLGDSLTQQLAQAFDAAALPPGDAGTASRRVLAGFVNRGPAGQHHHDCLVVSAPVRGTGATAYLRVTGLISKSNSVRRARCGGDTPPSERGAWSPERQALPLLRHPYALDPNRTAVRVGAFDAVVLRLPHGWLTLDRLTRERVVESIELCGESFGAATVVVATLPLSNNVRTPADWDALLDVNRMVRDVAATWPAAAGGERRVRRVLVQEFGPFTSQVVWTNARHLGYGKTEEVDFARRDWERNVSGAFLERLATGAAWSPSIPMVCAAPPHKGGECRRNRVSPDGMHWCVEYLGPRMIASLACLLGCVHNDRPGISSGRVRDCERACNDAFMSVMPVREEWLHPGTTLFSQSEAS